MLPRLAMLLLAVAAQVPAQSDNAWPGATLAGITVIAHRPHQVAEVTVTGHYKCVKPDVSSDPAATAPKVVSTYPASGSVIKPGLLVVRATFDQPMGCGYSFAYEDSGRSPCPLFGQHAILLSNDRRTFRVLCAVNPGSRFELWINSEKYKHFVGISGIPAVPYKVAFSTSSEPMIRTIHDALAEDPVGETELKVVQH